MRGLVFHLCHPPHWLEGKRLLVSNYRDVSNQFCSFSRCPFSHYIDDRHVGQLRLPLRPRPHPFTDFQLAEMAAFIACLTSISLGYFIGLSKSFLSPVTFLTSWVIFVTQKGRPSCFLVISVTSLLLCGSPFWSTKMCPLRIFRSLRGKRRLLPCWFQLQSYTPMQSSRLSPAPLLQLPLSPCNAQTKKRDSTLEVLRLLGRMPPSLVPC